MRANEFIVENFKSDLSVRTLKDILGVIKDEAESVNDATMMKDSSDPKYKKLEKDYQALAAISYVINNNLKAHKLYQENPNIFDTNIFMYDVEPDDILGGIAAIQISLQNNLAEIKWLGSYGGFGSKLMKSALDLAKSRGATQVKVDAKWNSEGFYRKMGLEQDPDAEPDRGEVFRGSKLTAFKGDLEEGGWSSLATQSTVIHPSTVKRALVVMNRFVRDFNKYIENQGLPPITMGPPTGSSSYYKVDPEDKVYGDIDLQVIVPDTPETADKTPNQKQYYWNKLFGEFQRTQSYVHQDSVPGRPIVQIGPNDWVQIDLMPHVKSIAKWARYRVTPERGMKGVLQGNVFTALGRLLNLNRGELGIQYKVRDGERMPYSKTLGNYELKTVSTNIETFLRDIFNHEYALITKKNPKTAKIDPLLAQYPGQNIQDIRIQNLARGIQGMAKSFELNNMYGHRVLKPYRDAQHFIARFLEEYESKCLESAHAKKRDKAETPEAKARAEADKAAILTGLAKVKAMFGQENSG